MWLNYINNLTPPINQIQSKAKSNGIKIKTSDDSV